MEEDIRPITHSYSFVFFDGIIVLEERCSVVVIVKKHAYTIHKSLRNALNRAIGELILCLTIWLKTVRYECAGFNYATIGKSHSADLFGKRAFGYIVQGRPYCYMTDTKGSLQPCPFLF